jgi:CheY-like chemotaxis protein
MTKTVLMVDDDPIDAYAVRRIVKRLQLATRVEHVEDGEQALVWLDDAEQMPCCVLLDLNMPRMNGREFLRMMRQHPRAHAIPVYIITTSTREEDILACKESGYSGYVLKSTELEMFSDDMTAVLQEACG